MTYDDELANDVRKATQEPEDTKCSPCNSTGSTTDPKGKLMPCPHCKRKQLAFYLNQEGRSLRKGTASNAELQPWLDAINTEHPVIPT